MNNCRQPIRILIVDDMAQVRRELRAVLTLAGEAAGMLVQVVGEAGDGEEAIHLARTVRPDAVLMDLAMPGTDGYAATRAIKAENPALTVIALTVHSSSESRAKAYQAGADGFIVKGGPVVEILQALSAAA